jgi:hypothetical protein
MRRSIDFRQLFENEPWQNRVAYVLMLVLAVLYVVSQIAMAVLWIAGRAQLDSM